MISSDDSLSYPIKRKARHLRHHFIPVSPSNSFKDFKTLKHTETVLKIASRSSKTISNVSKKPVKGKVKNVLKLCSTSGTQVDDSPNTSLAGIHRKAKANSGSKRSTDVSKKPANGKLKKGLKLCSTSVTQCDGSPNVSTTGRHRIANSGSKRVADIPKKPVNGKVKKDSKLLSTSVAQGDGGPNVSKAGRNRNCPSKKPRKVTKLNDTSTKTVKVLNKYINKKLPSSQSASRKGASPKKSTSQRVDVDVTLSPQPSSDLSDCPLNSDSHTLPTSQHSVGSMSSTPRRGRGRSSGKKTCVDFTLDRSSSTDIPFSIPLSPLTATQEELSTPCIKRQGQPEKDKPSKTTLRRKRISKESQTCGSGHCPPAKRAYRKGRQTEISKSGKYSNTKPPQRCRPRFEPQDSDLTEKDESSLSSDLSIELSLLEEHPTTLSSQVEEEYEEDVEEEELPSFLIQMEKKPLSITEGICVWCKFRTYPFWPAVVKSVNRKMKKASIVFIDDQLFDKKSIRKGISVALKTLKPFDCADTDELVCKAGETYDEAIKWCMELIADYRIRVGCGSFTGSIIEYLADNISCPVRRKYPQGYSELTFPSKLMMEDQSVECDVSEESSSEQQQQDEKVLCSKKLLPDRSKAARNRANKKLVHFIVKQRMAEKHLLSVISGQQPSPWVRSFLMASKKVVDTYLEDEEQVDQVYKYLEQVYKKASSITPSLANVDLIRFILDVLLPEAVICAIAGVDNVSMAEAKDKYLKGPCISRREKEWFDRMIEKQIRMKADGQKPAC